MSSKIKAILQRAAVTLFVLGVLLCCIQVPWRASIQTQRWYAAQTQEWFLGYSSFWSAPTPTHPFDPVYEARKKWPHLEPPTFAEFMEERRQREKKSRVPSPSEWMAQREKEQGGDQKNSQAPSSSGWEVVSVTPPTPSYWTDEELGMRLKNPEEFRKFVPGADHWSDRKIRSILNHYSASRSIPPEVFAYAQIDYSRIGIEVFCLALVFGLALYLLRPIR